MSGARGRLEGYRPLVVKWWPPSKGEEILFQRILAVIEPANSILALSPKYSTSTVGKFLASPMTFGNVFWSGDSRGVDASRMKV